MKSLKENILEKLKVDSITFEKFPIDASIEEIENFLKECGFEEIIFKNGDWVKSIHKKFDKNRGKKVFEYCPTIEELRFADMSKDISVENPIFVKDYKFFYIEPKLGSLNSISLNKEDFLKALNKKFGWQ